MDQAVTLRRLSQGTSFSTPRTASSSSMLRGLAVASGKGGVGKTNTVANLGYALSSMGKRVLVLDADMGLGNIHILLGLAPRYTLQHVISGERGIEDIIIRGPGGLDILPAASGTRKFSNLTGEEMLTLKTELEVLESNYDFILFDLGAGISSNVTYFCSAAKDVAVITSSEPTSFADAYAFMKVLSRDFDKRDFKLIVNSVKSKKESLDVFSRLSQVSDRFGLDIRIDLLGHIVHDPVVSTAVRRQMLFTEKYPNSPAAMCIYDIADNLVRTLRPAEVRWGKIFS